MTPQPWNKEKKKLSAQRQHAERIRKRLDAVLREGMKKNNIRVISDFTLRIKYRNMVECGNYGCKELRDEKQIFCESCYKESLEDPDAFK